MESVSKDHSYENPEKIELGDIVSETDKEIETLQNKMNKLKAKVKVLNQKLHRRHKKIQTLESPI